MEFFDKFERIVGIIPNLIGLAFFCEMIIYFDKARKKSQTRRESTFYKNGAMKVGKCWRFTHPLPQLRPTPHHQHCKMTTEGGDKP